MEERSWTLAARLLGRALALPSGDPLRATAEASAPARLSSVRGWRLRGRQAWARARIPPCQQTAGVTFRLDVCPIRAGATAAERESVATLHLAFLPLCAVRLWTDGSVEGGVFRRWAGAVLVWLDEEVEELRAPAGELCYSYRAEMVALVTGPETLLGRDRDQDLRSVPIC